MTQNVLYAQYRTMLLLLFMHAPDYPKASALGLCIARIGAGCVEKKRKVQIILNIASLQCTVYACVQFRGPVIRLHGCVWSGAELLAAEKDDLAELIERCTVFAKVLLMPRLKSFHVSKVRCIQHDACPHI